jgi:hypothetical protein
MAIAFFILGSTISPDSSVNKFCCAVLDSTNSDVDSWHTNVDSVSFSRWPAMVGVCLDSLSSKFCHLLQKEKEKKKRLPIV